MDGLKLHVEKDGSGKPYWVMELFLAGQRVAVTEAIDTAHVRSIMKSRLEYLWGLAHGKTMGPSGEIAGQGNLLHPDTKEGDK